LGFLPLLVQIQIQDFFLSPLYRNLESLIQVTVGDPVVGEIVGSVFVGSNVGLVVGYVVGLVLGLNVGFFVGLSVGAVVGPVGHVSQRIGQFSWIFKSSQFVALSSAARLQFVSSPLSLLNSSSKSTHGHVSQRTGHFFWIFECWQFFNLFFDTFLQVVLLPL